VNLLLGGCLIAIAAAMARITSTTRRAMMTLGRTMLIRLKVGVRVVLLPTQKQKKDVRGLVWARSSHTGRRE
jgi:hypothetical protein